MAGLQHPFFHGYQAGGDNTISVTAAAKDGTYTRSLSTTLALPSGRFKVGPLTTFAPYHSTGTTKQAVQVTTTEGKGKIKCYVKNAMDQEVLLNNELSYDATQRDPVTVDFQGKITRIEIIAESESKGSIIKE